MDNLNFIANIKRKNIRALEFVVDHYSSMVYKVIRSVLPASDCEAISEECMNDVFWLVWCNIHSFDETKGDFKSWIAAIAKYKAIDCKRKMYKQGQWLSISDGTIYEETSTEEIVVTKENRKELMNAINDMKDEDREIFIRRYFLGEGIENIAKAFSVDRNVVDKRLSRGRQYLKEKLVFWKGEKL
ncbi:RNA polymerase sigma factor, sigma-70 family [Desulfosporosinus orientis DSM 765]|uniref:RNA polymerase sigma factor, sigma-70 family n=1 Tax=Desulfosporosinus orientis (strain ATCC 19365 / DSM 765 / NCIMB 8382 / VKM B-1628 / Singapore I) TaxID=768706 RepID=G7WBC0_DESOD|nr:sigma-70 family RNA polymerase sigma factor [Desulfosporosinus orientis]AET68249.1 RNA polymerase sigma factor, sigma-70 family [Desulfosporosinus orientis DSM 765]